MDHRPRLEARRGMNVGAGLEFGRGMDARARLDPGFAELIAALGAGRLIGGFNGVPHGAHELEIQLRGDQIDGGRDSHARA